MLTFPEKHSMNSPVFLHYGIYAYICGKAGEDPVETADRGSTAHTPNTYRAD